MLRCIEQKVCNISYMQPSQKIKFNDWYMKIDQPMWIAADFECMNISISDNGNVNDNDNDDDNSKNDDNNNANVNDHDNKGVTDKLFANKPVAIGYNIVKNPDYENLNLEKDGYMKYFGEESVEWFINEMLEIEDYMKTFFKNELEINLDTISENYDQITCWLCEKNFRPKDKKENPIVKAIAI